MLEPTPILKSNTIYTGQTFTFRFQMTSGSNPAVPVDFTGATAVFTISEKQGVGMPVLLSSIGNSPKATVSLLEDGWAEVKINASVTSTITWKRGFYTLKITWSTGDTWRIFHGEIGVSFGA